MWGGNVGRDGQSSCPNDSGKCQIACAGQPCDLLDEFCVNLNIEFSQSFTMSTFLATSPVIQRCYLMEP